MSATTEVAPAKKAKTELAAPALAAYSLNKPEELSGLATLLQYHIQDKRLYTDIQGRKHVNVEGWQFAGAMLGIVPIVEKVEDVSTHQPQVFKGYNGKADTTVAHTEFRATVSLLDLRTGSTIGRGIASCSNFESKKRGFDPYAVESMAQTRATGKAFRLLLAWIMQAGGYATTPAEEMPDPEPETSAAVVVEPAAKQLADDATKNELRGLLDQVLKLNEQHEEAQRAMSKLHTMSQDKAVGGIGFFKKELHQLQTHYVAA